VVRRRLTCGLAALCLALTAGCGDELQLRRDDRLHFVSPPEGARVSAPVVVRWRVDRGAFRPAAFDGRHDPMRGVFAVFVDRPPMAPGASVDSLGDGDRVCAVSPGCPDEAWLADHAVYLTTKQAIGFPALPVGGGRPVGAGQRRHEVTVVLLDGRGVRIGEAAWTRSFSVAEEPGP
jgi:hypothetical protein